MTRLPVAMIKPVGTPAGRAPIAPFVGLATLWVQITGTWCNLECRHCINASGPKSPWLKPLDAATIARAIREAEAAGVKEIYFTGGEPFLHGEILPLLELALARRAHHRAHQRHPHRRRRWPMRSPRSPRAARTRSSCA